jgi:hypothetical protein
MLDLFQAIARRVLSIQQTNTASKEHLESTMTARKTKGMDFTKNFELFERQPLNSFYWATVHVVRKPELLMKESLLLLKQYEHF